MPDLHYLPDASRIQKQSSANKQGSAEAVGHDKATDIICELQRQQEEVYGYYDAWVGNGIAKEVARINTPVSRYSKMRAKGNLRNWFQFLNLRMRPDAQWEIRMYANEVGKIIQSLWPKAYSLFEEYDLYGAHFSRTELRALRTMLVNYTALMKDFTPSQETVDRITKSTGLSGTKLKEFMTKLEFGGEKIL